nr:hypothetical protein [Halovivax sp.]
MRSPTASTKIVDRLVEAIRECVEETADGETVQKLVAETDDDDQLEFESVERLVGAEIARRLRLLEADLEDEPLDLAAPDEVDIYDDGSTSTPTDDDR